MKHSPKERLELERVAASPPKRNGGRLSVSDRTVLGVLLALVKDWPFIRLNDGRRGAAILRLGGVSNYVYTTGWTTTYSANDGGLGKSSDGRAMGAGESSIMSSSPIMELGVGEADSDGRENGVLCGSGESSMYSVNGAGEDEGSGGVVT